MRVNSAEKMLILIVKAWGGQTFYAEDRIDRGPVLEIFQ